MDMRGRGTLGSLLTRQFPNKKMPSRTKKNILDGSRETLISLGVVVLETNLELNGLDEVALLLAIGIGKKFLNGAPHACH